MWLLFSSAQCTVFRIYDYYAIIVSWPISILSESDSFSEVMKLSIASVLIIITITIIIIIIIII